MSRPSLLPADGAGLERAVDALRTGRLILHPTETVVSLSGDPYRPEAVARVRRVKGYEEPRPFLCLVPGIEAAREMARWWPRNASRLAEEFWPGPLTLIVRAATGAPDPVVSDGGVAIRLASDPVSLALLEAWSRPLFSTSANPRGTSPSLDVAEAADALAGAPGADAIALGLLEPPTGPGVPSAIGEPSTIVDLTEEVPRLVRAGATPRDRLLDVVPELEDG